jgi:hypothetical protein
MPLDYLRNFLSPEAMKNLAVKVRVFDEIELSPDYLQ